VGANYFSASGALIRLTDRDRDGVADGPGQVLFTGLVGAPSSMRVEGRLVFVTGQGSGKPITVLRLGTQPGDALSLVGRLVINYPAGGWLHPHSALAVRPTPGQPGSTDLFFQLGSDANFAATTRTATLSNEGIAGGTGTLAGDSIHALTVTDHGTHVTAGNLRRVARGLRNAAGFAFHPDTGDLWFEDNGIDGLVDANEPTSADELNVISRADLDAGVVGNFGFPANYTAYRTGVRFGGAGLQPKVEFLPLPDLLTGSESEGPNDVAIAPPAFPAGLNQGVFVGFHGKFGGGGIANEENPLVYADPVSGKYFHFIGNDEPDIGHLDGLLTTTDSLYAADLTSNGSLGSGGGKGVIYQIRSLAPAPVEIQRDGDQVTLRWSRGVLESAPTPQGPWQVAGNAGQSPVTIAAPTGAGWYRVYYGSR
jgi:hypothetical protein